MSHPADPLSSPPPRGAAAAGFGASGPGAPVPDAALRAELGDRLARTLARRRGAYLSQLAREGVSAGQIGVLLRLRCHGDLSISGLADLLGLGLPNVTGVVDRLEERGLVERRRDPVDRRVVRVRLTEAGAGVPDGMEGLQRDVLGRVLLAMDRATLERCLEVLDEVEAEDGPTPSDPRCAGAFRRPRI